MRYFIYCRKSSEAEDRQVLSIESQLSTLRRTFDSRADIEIVEVYEEAFSAKSPGRPRFNEMITRIENGGADGIVAWAPDRLARNSIDGGRIIYMLDQGVISDLKFATYTFENNSQGKFMLQIMFGQSKYYSDALSENVKRGNRTKIERGWRPNHAPLGYLNDPATKTIVKDLVHYPLVRKIFELMLSGTHTPKQIAIIARDEWGFRTPRRKRTGGVPLAMSTVYKILTNPFYAGLIQWNGQIYPGRHEPVVTIEQLEQVGRLLRRPSRPRPRKHRFAFTGMIRCGGCDLGITAEHKVNRFGGRYIYYHCSKRRLGPRCNEPSVEGRSLLCQVEAFLGRLTIDPRIEAWVLQELASQGLQFQEEEAARRQSLEHALEEVSIQLNELTGLRLRRLLTDAEFTGRRQELQTEQLRLREKIAAIEDSGDRFEPAREVILFRNRAADWFMQGDDQVKRLILETVGSNLTLRSKILSIEAAKSFAMAPSLATNTRLLGVVDVVRTLAAQRDPELRRIVDNIKKLKIMLGITPEAERRAA